MSIRQLMLVCLGLVLVGGGQGANILAIFSCPSESHLIVEMSVAKVLAEKGHNVTVVTTLKPRVSHKNMHIIEIPLTAEEQKILTSTISEMTKTDNTNIISSMHRMRRQLKIMFDKNRDVMKDRRVTDLYENKDNKFDLVMIGFFLNSFQMGIAHKLKVPVIIATSTFYSELFTHMLANPAEISYVPSMGVHFDNSKPINFRQRFINFLTWSSERFFAYLMEKDNAVFYNELYGDDPNMPPYEELNRNVSLVFFNSHGISESPIRPNVPGIIEVGGIQVKEKPDPLPRNIAEFLSDAPHGAIILSLGSNVKGAFLKPETVRSLFNVLSKLEQKVIWKWEDLDNTPGKSKNILYSKWLPQDDVLAHPNITLFINHAGRGGITESQYHGKPMLSLPVFGDQPGNAEKMVNDGFGLSLPLLTLEEETFRAKLKEVLENPKYSEKVKAFSVLFRDRPLSARESVLYWTEYVLRHHGAPHLQSPKVRMGFVEANNIDIYSLILISLILILLIVTLIVVKICRKLFGKLLKNSNKKKLQ